MAETYASHIMQLHKLNALWHDQTQEQEIMTDEENIGAGYSPQNRGDNNWQQAPRDQESVDQAMGQDGIRLSEKGAIMLEESRILA